MTEAIQTVVDQAEKLIASVDFDVNGLHGKGGHGGLTSNDTIRAADELRLAISRWRKARGEQG